MFHSNRYHRHNRIQQLRGFCYTLQTGSISRAAEHMELSQPSVSLHIQALEKELGEILLERRGPRIKATPAGEALYELARPIVEGIEALPQAFADKFGNLEGGWLDIAAGESTLLYLLPPYLQTFAKRYPGVHIRLHNVTGRDGMAMLRDDEVDFAVGSMLEVPDNIIYNPIFSYDPMLITALDHPLAQRESVTLKDIGPYGLILPPQHLSTWRRVKQTFQDHGVKYHVCLEAGGWEVIKRYVELNLGVSIVTSICLRESDQLHAVSVSRYFPQRTYGVVRRRGKFLTPQARHFIESMDSGFFGAQPKRPSRPEQPR